jgi:predicted ATP-grasp superfamily ATP-dependent carboligase
VSEKERASESSDHWDHRNLYVVSTTGEILFDSIYIMQPHSAGTVHGMTGKMMLELRSSAVILLCDLKEILETFVSFSVTFSTFYAL